MSSNSNYPYDRVYIEGDAWTPEGFWKRVFLKPGETYDGPGFIRPIRDGDLIHLPKASKDL